MKSSDKLTMMELYQIEKSYDAGLTIEEIASVMGLHRNTVSRALSREVGDKQRQLADRMEYFYEGKVVKDTGCYRTNPYQSEDGDWNTEQQELNDWTTK